MHTKRMEQPQPISILNIIAGTNPSSIRCFNLLHRHLHIVKPQVEACRAVRRLKDNAVDARKAAIGKSLIHKLRHAVEESVEFLVVHIDDQPDGVPGIRRNGSDQDFIAGGILEGKAACRRRVVDFDRAVQPVGDEEPGPFACGILLEFVFHRHSAVRLADEIPRGFHMFVAQSVRTLEGAVAAARR